MHRLSNGTQATIEMAPPAVIGTPGYPVGANPAGAQQAATIDPWQAVAIQEELAHVIETAGIVLDKTNNTQLLLAVRTLITGSFTDTLGPEGADGILTLPTGAIIQCFPTPEINVAIANTVYGYNIVFPEVFPSYCSVVVAADGGLDGTTWGGFSGVTTAGCGATVWSINPNNAARGFCLALGK